MYLWLNKDHSRYYTYTPFQHLQISFLRNFCDISVFYTACQQIFLRQMTPTNAILILVSYVILQSHLIFQLTFQYLADLCGIFLPSDTQCRIKFLDKVIFFPVFSFFLFSFHMICTVLSCRLTYDGLHWKVLCISSQHHVFMGRRCDLLRK